MTFKLFPSHQLKDKLTESLMERWTQILDLRNNERQERISLTMAHANVDVQNADPHSYNYSSLWQENTDVKTGSIIQSKVNPEKLHSNFLHGPFSDILIPINFIFICPYLFGGKKKVRIIFFTLGGKKIYILVHHLLERHSSHAHWVYLLKPRKSNFFDCNTSFPSWFFFFLKLKNLILT